MFSLGAGEVQGMPSDDDIALAEKRMYGARREATRAYVAGEMGVASVEASDDQIGRFGMATQATATDIAGIDGQLVVGTEEDVLVGVDGEFEPAGFGTTTAVGVGDGIHAAGPDGRIARRREGTWETVGTVDDVRAVAGHWIAANSGVYEITPDGLSHEGLDDVRAVTRNGRYAATGDGLFARPDGWRQVHSGDASLVAAEADAGDQAPRAHAVCERELLERQAGGWADAAAPTDGIVDVAYDEGTFCVTAAGEILLDPVTAKDGEPAWRSRGLGLRGVVGVAIP
jgi:hypothetical protein